VMLPFHSDLPANLVNMFSGLLAVLAIYVMGGALGLSPGRLKAGVALGAFLPAFAAYLPTQYVDPAAAALAMAGTALLAVWFAGGAWPAAPLGVLALALGFGLKPYGVTPLAVGTALALGFGFARRALTARRCAVLLLAACVGLPHYAAMARQFGNPFYPFPSKVLGRALGEAHPGLERYIEEADRKEREWFAQNHPGWEPSHLRAALYSARKVFAQSPMTLGPSPLILGLLGLGVLARMRNRWMAALIALNVLAAWAAFLNPAVEGLRLYFTVSYARILVFPSFLCLLAGLGAGARLRVVDLLFWLLALPGLILAFPSRMLTADWIMLGLAAVLFSAAAGFVKQRWHDGLVFLLAAGVLVLPLLSEHRDRLRHEYWARSYDLFPLSRQIMPLARELDRPEGRRLAVAFGEDLWGSDWAFPYPLMGSRLQNTLHYVPVGPGDKVPDRPDFEGEEGDPAAWYLRLKEARIDAVVLARPWTIERGWILDSRGLFSVLAMTGDYAAFEVRERPLNR
jgi:hypothetical protein